MELPIPPSPLQNKSTSLACSIRPPSVVQIPDSEDLFLPIGSFFHQQEIHAIAAFKHFSSNGNFLSEEEFSQLLFEVGCNLPDLHMHWAFQAADSDYDGEISKSEFLMMIKLPGQVNDISKTWRKCRVLPGYCTELSNHVYCDFDDIQYETLKLPELIEGMAHAKIVKWVKLSGDVIEKGDVICQVQCVDKDADIADHILLNQLNVSHKDIVVSTKHGVDVLGVNRITPKNLPPKLLEYLSANRINKAPTFDLIATQDSIFGKPLVEPNVDINVGSHIALLKHMRSVVDEKQKEGIIRSTHDYLKCDRTYFSKEARNGVFERRDEQRTFMKDVFDEKNVLPTKSIGLFHHMGDLGVPKPVVFKGTSEASHGEHRTSKNYTKNGGDTNTFGNRSSRNETQRKGVTPVHREGRSIPELVRALEVAKRSVEYEGKGHPVSDARMTNILRSSLIVDKDPLVREIGKSIPGVVNTSTISSMETFNKADISISFNDAKQRVLSHENVPLVMKSTQGKKGREEERPAPKPLAGNLRAWR